MISARDYLASLFDLSGKTALVTGGGNWGITVFRTPGIEQGIERKQ
jgi:hypothetical protein